MEVVGTGLDLPPEIESRIHWDKSWLIRLCAKDLFSDQSGPHETEIFLREQRTLSTDLQAVERATRQWIDGSDIDVGESGTLYRILQFAAWQRGEERTFIKQGTLRDRQITDDPSIIQLSLPELLRLDGGTSQWATAAVLLGREEAMPQAIPYKLQLTYEAVRHWKEAKATGQSLEVRRDITLGRQTKAYLGWLATGIMNFEPIQAEDYCFARAFGLITPQEGEAKWPSLRFHESDRIDGTEESLQQLIVTTDDHRGIQSITMLRGDNVVYLHPEATNKSWPELPEVIELAAA